VRGRKIEEHAVTDLVLRNNENRCSTSSRRTSRRIQSKNTTDEMAAVITVGKDIGLWLANIPKNAEFLVKKLTRTLRHCDEKLFLNHDVVYRKSQR